ncbi:MAG: hypothetical protein ACKO3G_03445, partial [Planctomycetaceae bacterium]
GSLARVLAATAGAPPEALVEALVLAALGRPPRATELEATGAALAQGSREEVAADLLWALVNSKEFTFNH